MALKMTTIQPDGSTRDWEIDADKLTYEDHWKDLQREIETDGGKPVSLLEFVRAYWDDGTEVCLIVDENGSAMGRERNPKATFLYKASPIHGAAILVHGRKFEIRD